MMTMARDHGEHGEKAPEGDGGGHVRDVKGEKVVDYGLHKDLDSVTTPVAAPVSLVQPIGIE